VPRRACGPLSRRGATGDAGCVAFAAANVAANADAALDAPCATALLRWGDAAADARAAALAPGPAAGVAPRGFDVCLGGDLIYDDTSSPARIGELVATVDNLLSRAPHAQFLLVRLLGVL
jgi:predicted nicotinamide N-methyase